ncbi:AbgT family transporter [Aliidiomarina haloalkalitolerans]|uniref:AbgT family transporter n=1 Tax=Aliidiomarina haloalkalitolerans TaxID=859059 RepID=A0A432VT75_9GAMM|nr:AbgT family transporter [Aliidiomarina haloalkalitolerans]RUO19580.1 hypothetical protein CWE06_08600 [Aliidiomarina haloalkalitolerans]
MSGGQTPSNAETQKRGWFTRFLDAVEYLGNLLPHPVSLFALFCVFVIVASGLAAFFGLSAADPRPAEMTGGEPGALITVNSLMIRTSTFGHRAK